MIHIRADTEHACSIVNPDGLNHRQAAGLRRVGIERPSCDHKMVHDLWHHHDTVLLLMMEESPGYVSKAELIALYVPH